MSKGVCEVEFTGGVHFGENYYNAMNATWPFASLEVDVIQLKLDTTFFRSFTFSASSISKLSRYAGFFSIGLRIEHTVCDYPPFIVFWTFNFGKVKTALAELGYSVIDS